MKKFLSVMKVVLYIVAILLIGQIPIATRTVGGHVQHGLVSAFEWSVKEIKSTDFYKSLGKVPVVSSVVTEPQKPQMTASLSPELSKPVMPESKPKAPTEMTDEFSAADRASLLQLLE